MPPTISKAQIRKLGERLCSDEVSPADLEMLATLQDDYLGALELVDTILRERLGLVSDRLYDGVSITLTNRLKRDRRIIEKLRRGTELDRMQDIVGFRIVGDFTLTQQTTLSATLSSTLPGRPARDRRSDPSWGYRAVHVVAEIDGFLVEIQLRTFLQDIWAQGMEQLSDAWGRDLQYGGAPEGPDEVERTSRGLAVDAFKALSPLMARVELAHDAHRTAETELEQIAAIDELDMASDSTSTGAERVSRPSRRRFWDGRRDEAIAELGDAGRELRLGIERYDEALEQAVRSGS